MSEQIIKDKEYILKIKSNDNCNMMTITCDYKTMGINSQILNIPYEDLSVLSHEINQFIMRKQILKGGK